MKKTKDQVQKEAVSAIEANNGKGIVVMATGAGKSKVVIDYALKHYDNPYAKILLVVPTEKLRDVNWKNEFEKWGAGHIYERVERSCYVSIHKIEDRKYDLVIMDEVHNITENNSSFFYQNEVTDVVGLTATLPENYIKRDILNDLNLRPIYIVTVDDAVEWGLISPYRVTIIETRLNGVLRNVPAGNKNKPFMQTEQEAYSYVTKSIEMLKNNDFRSPSDDKRMQMLIFKRMRLIYNLETKKKIAQFLLDRVIPRDERTLIFCGSIEQAKKLNPYSFHSKSKDSKDFDAFVSKEISRLSCVQSLNEGHNLPDVDNALIVQLNSKELNLVQRVGRIVRYRHGHIANIFIICVRGTVDEDWTRKATTNFGQENIEWLSFEQLKMNYL
jgi:superfamily II DNA or RNA helicase